jgi:hypothetical protein
MKIREGRELAFQVLVTVFFLIVIGAVSFVLFVLESPAAMFVGLLTVLGLLFLIGLRVSARRPGDRDSSN